MEMIKDVVKQFYSLILLLVCVSFVLWMFFSDGLNGKENVFEGAGKVFAPVIDTREIKSDGISYVKSSVSDYVPAMTYTGGIQTAGTFIMLKSMFDIELEDGTIVSGSTEDGFNIYLMDIINPAGNSALMFLTAEEITGMEEIPAPFAYEKEQDVLCCFESGVYTMLVKIYGANGGEKMYEFQLPVETS